MKLDCAAVPSDTHRKPITPITAVLLPFVTCLLTVPLILTRYEMYAERNTSFHFALLLPLDGIRITLLSYPCLPSVSAVFLLPSYC
jgi:hypothetical protein